MNTRKIALVGITFAISSWLAGCSGDPDSDSEVLDIQAFGLSIQPQAAGQSAVPVATELWKQISGNNDYRDWPLLAGTTERQDSDAPHGDFATIRYSGQDANAPGPGDTLVKELLVEDETEPQALTVMLKLSGFDPDNANWFYAKYLPDGSLDTTPTGVPLAGAMEPAPGAACRGCHRSAPGDDFQWL